jgi:hypothetical protein
MNSEPLCIEGLKPILVKPVEPNQELWDLHRLSALGEATEEEELRLKALMGDAASGPGSRPSDQANLRCPDATRVDPYRGMEDRENPLQPIFRNHNCGGCNSGERPCREGNYNSCSWPRARND